MADAIDPKLLDKRTAPRYIRSGLLDEKVHERALKSLPDLTDKAIPIEADLDMTADHVDDEDMDTPAGEA